MPENGNFTFQIMRRAKVSDKSLLFLYLNRFSICWASQIFRFSPLISLITLIYICNKYANICYWVCGYETFSVGFGRTPSKVGSRAGQVKLYLRLASRVRQDSPECSEYYLARRVAQRELLAAPAGFNPSCSQLFQLVRYVRLGSSPYKHRKNSCQ